MAGKTAAQGLSPRRPPGQPRPATWIGKRMDLHCTAVGKALIAFLPDEEVDRLVLKHGLLRHNDNTISSLKRLKQELAAIRAQGYSVDDEEVKQTAAAISGRLAALPAAAASSSESRERAAAAGQ